jgi:hypothetical protein
VCACIKCTERVHKRNERARAIRKFRVYST